VLVISEVVSEVVESERRFGATNKPPLLNGDDDDDDGDDGPLPMNPTQLELRLSTRGSTLAIATCTTTRRLRSTPPRRRRLRRNIMVEFEQIVTLWDCGQRSSKIGQTAGKCVCKKVGVNFHICNLILKLLAFL
jgi:hypothetical protein